MYQKKTSTFIAFAMITILIGFIGCRAPEEPRSYVLAGVEAPAPYDTTGDAFVFVWDVPEVPSVKINGIRIPLELLLNAFRFKHPDFRIFAGDSAKLLVTYKRPKGTSETAKARINLPDSFKITSPRFDTVTIRKGDSLIVKWDTSEYADAYSVFFYLEYEYIDTLGIHKSFFYEIETLLTTNSITFSKAKLFPALGEIDTIIDSWGYFDIFAVDGPWKEGDKGNVTGDGMGFFYGWTFGGDFEIYVRGSRYLTKEKPTNRLEEFLKEKAEKLNLY